MEEGLESNFRDHIFCHDKLISFLERSKAIEMKSYFRSSEVLVRYAVILVEKVRISLNTARFHRK